MLRGRGAAAARGRGGGGVRCAFSSARPGAAPPQRALRPRAARAPALRRPGPAASDEATSAGTDDAAGLPSPALVPPRPQAWAEPAPREPSGTERQAPTFGTRPSRDSNGVEARMSATKEFMPYFKRAWTKLYMVDQLLWVSAVYLLHRYGAIDLTESISQAHSMWGFVVPDKDTVDMMALQSACLGVSLKWLFPVRFTYLVVLAYSFALSWQKRGGDVSPREGLARMRDALPPSSLLVSQARIAAEALSVAAAITALLMLAGCGDIAWETVPEGTAQEVTKLARYLQEATGTACPSEQVLVCALSGVLFCIPARRVLVSGLRSAAPAAGISS
eukprot:TRINITY_DN19643_c0_g1_i2.p1 TRINITY_DN19643_c0_g1~~TRINITY_DN19643_c0_g1_i2.p1  ORF type:complete len:353 (+),score=98.71 TRINITY_DN19643_c0_g1_i2:62-1060(+)